MITSCICSALSELHRKNTVHRDLKLANILLTEDFVVKLADFGFSKQSEEELMKTYCGTPITMPPEILDHQNYKKENCDTWSLGVICYQMLYGQPPWMPEEIGLVSLMNCIRQKPLRFNEHV
jgi:serine/threonine protein kinase